MTSFYLQPCDEDGPKFREPWEAQAFGLVLAMHQRGLFSWEEWAEALHNAIHAAQASGDPDLGDTYYEHWLAALEQLAQKKACVSDKEISARKAQWRTAYLQTPHGQPVILPSRPHE